MKQSRFRALLTLLLSLTALFAFSAPAHAENSRPTTTIAGKPGLFGLTYDMTPRAKLIETETGAPVVGATILFQSESPAGYAMDLCTAVTDSNGIAKCGGAKAVKAIFTIMQSPNKDYLAYFAGRQVGEINWQASYDRVRFLHK